jgi:hypothetical protein
VIAVLFGPPLRLGGFGDRLLNAALAISHNSAVVGAVLESEAMEQGGVSLRVSVGHDASMIRRRFGARAPIGTIVNRFARDFSRFGFRGGQ